MQTSNTSENSGVIQIPANHNVTGTCGECGGPIISPILWSGTEQPNEWCMHCGQIPKSNIWARFGPIRTMKPKETT